MGGLLVTGDRSGVELLEGKADDDSKELRLFSNSRDADVVAFAMRSLVRCRMLDVPCLPLRWKSISSRTH